MTPDELRAKWAFAAPEERNATVAEAMGFVVRYPYDAADPWIEKPPTQMMKQCPQWTTSWADAGPLLDDLLTFLRRNGNMEAVVKLRAVVEEGMRWEVAWTPGPPEWMQRVSAATAPEAIALAYTLARLEDR